MKAPGEESLKMDLDLNQGLSSHINVGYFSLNFKLLLLMNSAGSYLSAPTVE